jgi:hypothetical protein
VFNYRERIATKNEMRPELSRLDAKSDDMALPLKLRKTLSDRPTGWWSSSVRNVPANPEADVQRLFKTVARMARFHSETDCGLAAGIERALDLMPCFPDYYTRVHGVECTNRHLLNLVRRLRSGATRQAKAYPSRDEPIANSPPHCSTVVSL